MPKNADTGRKGNESEKWNGLSERIARLEGRADTAKWLLGGGAGILLMYLGWVGSAIIGHGNQISGISAQLSEMHTLLAPQRASLRLQQIISAPTTGLGDLDEADKIFTAAKKTKTIQPDLARLVGWKFMGKAKEDPRAWQTVSTVLDYRAAWNEQAAPPLPDLTSSGHSSYQPYVPGPDGAHIQVKYSGRASTANSARMELLKNPPKAPSLAEFILVELGGAGIGLDGLNLKNVVLRNGSVSYSGGPVRMEGVYFINCTFKITRDANGEELSRSILDSVPTNFSAGPPQKEEGLFRPMILRKLK